MRFLFTSIIMLLVLAFQLEAQPVEVGARGGFNFYTMFGDTYSELGFRPGLVLGIYGRTSLKGGKYDGQVELNYSQEGAKNGNYDFSTFSTVVYNQVIAYNYLNIPVFIIGSLAQVAEGLEWQGGIQIGINLEAKEVRTVKSGTASPTDMSVGTRKFNDRIKTIYPSLIGGASLDVSDKIRTQLRVSFSPFDNVRKKAGDSEGTYPLGFQISASYALSEVNLKTK